MKRQYSIVAVALFFGVGLYLSVFSRHFNTAASLSSLSMNQAIVSRSPAAIRQNYDFSGLGGSALESAQKQRILSGAKVVRQKTDVGLELGHFVLKGEDGQKAFACQKYEKISMTFIGDGSAVNGELPKMEVEGLCEMSADINSISPLWIPVAKILGESVAEGEFSFREGRPVALRFSNVQDQWPTTWQLQNIRLFTNEKDPAEVVINAKELKQFTNGPVLLNWK